MKKNGTEIIKPGRKIGVSFVTVVFFLMLIYLLARSFSVLTGKTISAYQVGSPSADQIERTFTGLLLREEQLFYAEGSGELQYYRTEGDRLSDGALVCLIDRKGTLSERLRSAGSLSGLLSESSLAKIQEQVLSLQESYDPRSFQSASGEIAGLRGLICTRLLAEDSGDILDSDDVLSVRCDQTGFLLLSRDGLEGKAPEELALSDFSSEPSAEKRMSGETVQSGAFLYKLATDNAFQLVFPLTDGELASLGTRSTLSVTMEDGLTISGSFSVTKLSDGTDAGVLSFRKYGLNYLEQRLVSFRIADEETEGFKIPESALTRKSFFVVPSGFVTSDLQGQGKAVLVEGEDGVSYVSVVAYAAGSDDSAGLIIGGDVCYIDGDGLEAGTVLLLEETDPETGEIRTQRETLGVMATLEGVYQINKGYCVFKPVLRIGASVEASYIMVSADISYSLKAFDRIVLDASGVRENEIVYE